MRNDGRQANELRPVKLEMGFLDHAEGSCLATAGRTRVICAASVERRVPPFLANSGQGWVTAEYGLLPRSTHERVARETTPRGRTQEIQRFVGRSLRAVCNLAALGEQQIIIDCDVLQADGGTRVLALTGGFCALWQAVGGLGRGVRPADVILEHVAAVSVGIVGGEPLLDLAYEEDSRAETDMNVVMTESGRIVEIQATAEHMPFTYKQFNGLYELAAGGIRELVKLQKTVLAGG
jgi:ribonuclease PH